MWARGPTFDLAISGQSLDMDLEIFTPIRRVDGDFPLEREHEHSSWKSRWQPGFHADRAARRHRDHRGVDRPAAAGRAGGARGGPPRPVHQQPEAVRPGGEQLRVGQRLLSRAGRTRTTTAGSPAKGCANGVAPCDFPENFSVFVRMLPYTEQSPMYNAVNFNLTSNFENITIAGVRLNILTCPSDTTNDPVHSSTAPNASFNLIAGTPPPGNWIQCYSSYAGNAGTWDYGTTTLANPAVRAMYNGDLQRQHTAIALVTDGTSNTFLFAEHSHFMATLNDPYYYVSDNSWQSGRWYDTLFCHALPDEPQPSGIPAQANGPYGYYAITAANSLHPGGANFAFCDGRSVSSRTRSTPGASSGTVRTPTATPSPTARPP